MVHLRFHAVVRTEQYAILILDKELTCGARRVSTLGYTGRYIDIKVRVLIQQCSQPRPIVCHIQVVARNKQRSRILAYRVLEGRDKPVIAVAVRRINVPNDAIGQTVVFVVHRQVHPDRFSYMNTDRHLQLAGFPNERLDTRIINMDVFAFHGTGVRVTFAFVAQLAYTRSTQLVTIAR